MPERSCPPPTPRLSLAGGYNFFAGPAPLFRAGRLFWHFVPAAHLNKNIKTRKYIQKYSFLYFKTCSFFRDGGGCQLKAGRIEAFRKFFIEEGPH